jgi:peptide-methionine (S)-S-oxide reductase
MLALLALLAALPQSRESVMVLAGGCFWGVEAVFEHVLGVRSVTSGFARPADAEKGFVPGRSGADHLRSIPGEARPAALDLLHHCA